MEKLIVRTTLLTVFMFPLTAFSATYNACADSGTCNSYNTSPGNASSGNMGAHQPGWSPGGGMGGGPSAADLAAKEKAEQEGKKKYCKDNGYPANVPFCAAFKQQAIESCKDGVNQRYDLALFDANERMISSYADCHNTYSIELLASLTACLDQVDGHFNGAVSGITEDQKIGLGNCSNM